MGDTINRILSEVIAALDRRRPHVDRAGEAAIARDAAALRSLAVNRLAAIERTPDDGSASAPIQDALITPGQRMS